MGMKTKVNPPYITLLLFAAMSCLLVAPAVAQTPDEDLDIGWIHRTPELEYVTNSPQPDVDGWPAVGEIVTWQAGSEGEAVVLLRVNGFAGAAASYDLEVAFE